VIHGRLIRSLLLLLEHLDKVLDLDSICWVTLGWGQGASTRSRLRLRGWIRGKKSTPTVASLSWLIVAGSLSLP